MRFNTFNALISVKQLWDTNAQKGMITMISAWWLLPAGIGGIWLLLCQRSGRGGPT